MTVSIQFVSRHACKQGATIGSHVQDHRGLCWPKSVQVLPNRIASTAKMRLTLSNYHGSQAALISNTAWVTILKGKVHPFFFNQALQEPYYIRSELLHDQVMVGSDPIWDAAGKYESAAPFLTLLCCHENSKRCWTKSGIIEGIRWCDFWEPELNVKYHIS